MKPPGRTARLTDKQRRFCQEYMLDMNGAQAARRAGYSEGSTRRVATRMLKNHYVADYLAELQRQQRSRLEITADRVLQELARIAFVDPGKIMRVEKGRVRITQTDELDDDHRAVIAEISETDRGGIRCKLTSKEKALELLGRHLGLFVDRHEHSGPGGGPIRTNDVAKLSDAELERIAAGH